MAWGSGYAQPSNWQTLKRTVLQRDGGVCYLCGGDAITADHIVPVSQGGTHELSNLAAICGPCHQTKTKAERQAGMRARKRRPMRLNIEDHPNKPQRGTER